MNEDTVIAFKAFDSTLSTAIRTLHETLQDTNSLHAVSMYSDQFNDIVSFQQKTKAFTQFLNQQNEYHQLQYHKFKSSQLKQRKTIEMNSKPHAHAVSSSQLSIQSTPQSLNDWSYTANDGASAQDLQWRGFDPQMHTAYDCSLFNDADIDIIPFKVIDTDNESECTENIVPSLPPSIHMIQLDRDDDTKEIEEGSNTNLYMFEEEDVADDAEDEDEDKWDPPLIKTIAFAGFFDTEPTAQIEFKNDNVVKPHPASWQEREEENKQIIEELWHNEINDNTSQETVEIVAEAAVEAAVEDVELSLSTTTTAQAELAIDDAMNNDVELLSNDVVFSIKTCTEPPPPISFIEYERPIHNTGIDRIEDHPHYHPLIHGEEGKVELEETGINGEVTLTADHDETVWFANEMNDIDDYQKQFVCGYMERNGMNIVNENINGLRNALDDHFNRNHNDFSDIKHALYSFRGHCCNYNDTKKKKRRNQEQRRIRKKSMEHR